MPGYERRNDLVGGNLFLYLALTDSSEFERLVRAEAQNGAASVAAAENQALNRPSGD